MTASWSPDIPQQYVPGHPSTSLSTPPQLRHMPAASCRSSCRRALLRGAATAIGRPKPHRDVRGSLGHTTFETMQGSLSWTTLDLGRPEPKAAPSLARLLLLVLPPRPRDISSALLHFELHSLIRCFSLLLPAIVTETHECVQAFRFYSRFQQAGVSNKIILLFSSPPLGPLLPPQMRCCPTGRYTSPTHLGQRNTQGTPRKTWTVTRVLV